MDIERIPLNGNSFGFFLLRKYTKKEHHGIHDKRGL